MMKKDKIYEAYQKVISESTIDGNFETASGNLDKIWRTVRPKYPETWKKIARDAQKVDGLINDIWTEVSKHI